MTFIFQQGLSSIFPSLFRDSLLYVENLTHDYMVCRFVLEDSSFLDSIENPLRRGAPDVDGKRLILKSKAEL